MSDTPWPLRLWLGGSAVMPRIAEYQLARRVHSGQRSSPSRLVERLGRATLERPEKPLVWINAASVGEVASIADLALDLKAEGLGVLITTTTTTGAARATRIGDDILHQYQPLDTARAARRFLDHWKPDLACMVEGDLWPRLLSETAARDIPLALLNARPSRSRSRAPRITTALLRPFKLITAQTQSVADEIMALGLAQEKLVVPGDLKAAASHLPADPDRLAVLRRDFSPHPLWAAVSTHASDEPAVIEAHLSARKRHSGLRLILAPRHPDRGDAVTRQLADAGLSVARLTRSEPASEADVWLVDRIGETGLIFRLAPLVFLGGSLGQQGGHNPWEPAALGAALLHGPNVRNAAAAYDALDAAGAARQVTDARSLGEAVEALIGSPALDAMRNAAQCEMRRYGQARHRTLDALKRLLARP